VNDALVSFFFHSEGRTSYPQCIVEVLEQGISGHMDMSRRKWSFSLLQKNIFNMLSFQFTWWHSSRMSSTKSSSGHHSIHSIFVMITHTVIGMIMGMTVLYVWSWQNRSSTMLLLLLYGTLLYMTCCCQYMQDSLL